MLKILSILEDYGILESKLRSLLPHAQLHPRFSHNDVTSSSYNVNFLRLSSLLRIKVKVNPTTLKLKVVVTPNPRRLYLCIHCREILETHWPV